MQAQTPRGRFQDLAPKPSRQVVSNISEEGGISNGTRKKRTKSNIALSTPRSSGRDQGLLLDVSNHDTGSRRVSFVKSAYLESDPSTATPVVSMHSGSNQSKSAISPRLRTGRFSPSSRQGVMPTAPLADKDSRNGGRVLVHPPGTGVTSSSHARPSATVVGMLDQQRSQSQHSHSDSHSHSMRQGSERNIGSASSSRPNGSVLDPKDLLASHPAKDVVVVLDHSVFAESQPRSLLETHGSMQQQQNLATEDAWGRQTNRRRRHVMTQTSGSSTFDAKVLAIELDEALKEVDELRQMMRDLQGSAKDCVTQETERLFSTFATQLKQIQVENAGRVDRLRSSFAVSLKQEAQKTRAEVQKEYEKIESMLHIRHSEALAYLMDQIKQYEMDLNAALDMGSRWESKYAILERHLKKSEADFERKMEALSGTLKKASLDLDQLVVEKNMAHQDVSMKEQLVSDLVEDIQARDEELVILTTERDELLKEMERREHKWQNKLQAAVRAKSQCEDKMANLQGNAVMSEQAMQEVVKKSESVCVAAESKVALAMEEKLAAEGREEELKRVLEEERDAMRAMEVSRGALMEKMETAENKLIMTEKDLKVASDENVRLTQQVKEYNMTIVKLGGASSLEAQLQMHIRSREEQEVELRSLRHQLLSYDAGHQITRNTLKKIKEKLEAANSLNERLQSDYDQVTKTELKALKERTNSQAEKIDALLAEYEESKSKYQSEKAKNDLLTKRVEELSHKSTTLSLDTQAWQDMKDSAEANARMEQAKTAKLAAQLQNTHERMKELKTEEGSAKEQLANDLEARNKLLKAAEKNLRVAEKTISKLENDLQLAENAKTEENEKVAAIQKEVEVEAAKCREMHEKYMNSMMLVTDLEGKQGFLSQKVTSLTEALEKLRGKYEILQDTHAKCRSSQNSRGDNNSGANDSNNTNESVTRLQTDLNITQRKLESATANCEELQQLLNQTMKENSDLEAKLITQTLAASRMQVSSSDMDSGLQKLREQHGKQQARIAELENECSEISAREGEAKRKALALQLQLESEQIRVVHAESRESTVHEEKMMLEGQLQSLQQLLAQLDGIVKEAQHRQADSNVDAVEELRGENMNSNNNNNQSESEYGESVVSAVVEDASGLQIPMEVDSKEEEEEGEKEHETEDLEVKETPTTGFERDRVISPWLVQEGLIQDSELGYEQEVDVVERASNAVVSRPSTVYAPPVAKETFEVEERASVEVRDACVGTLNRASSISAGASNQGLIGHVLVNTARLCNVPLSRRSDAKTMTMGFTTLTNVSGQDGSDPLVHHAGKMPLPSKSGHISRMEAIKMLRNKSKSMPPEVTSRGGESEGEDNAVSTIPTDDSGSNLRTSAKSSQSGRVVVPELDPTTHASSSTSSVASTSTKPLMSSRMARTVESSGMPMNRLQSTPGSSKNAAFSAIDMAFTAQQMRVLKSFVSQQSTSVLVTEGRMGLLDSEWFGQRWRELMQQAEGIHLPNAAEQPEGLHFPGSDTSRSGSLGLDGKSGKSKMGTSGRKPFMQLRPMP